MRGPGPAATRGIVSPVVGGYAGFRARSWHGTGTTNLGGALPFVLVAIGDITIDDTFAARGKCNMGLPGPGGLAGSDLDQP